MARRRLPEVLTVQVVTYGAASVTLVGAIAPRPQSGQSGEGRYVLERRTTLMELVASNALINEESDLSAVIIRDAEGKVGIFDLHSARYGLQEDQNPVLENGDIITVPSVSATRGRIFVLGEIENPGVLSPRPGLTVLDAIARAGGLNDRATGSTVNLIRGRGEDAELFKIPYNSIVRRGNMEWNVYLQPGDVIYVSRSTYDQVTEIFRDIWAAMQAAVLTTVLIEGR